MKNNYLLATLLPETMGCVDIHDHDTLCRHVCDGRPGAVIAGGPPPDDGNSDREGHGPVTARWRLGNTVRLLQVERARNPKMADFVDLLLDMERDLHGEREPEDTLAPFHSWEPLSPELPQASFQWKGTTAYLRFTCVCAAELQVDGQEFLYTVQCPGCRAIFSVDWHVPVERIA